MANILNLQTLSPPIDLSQYQSLEIEIGVGKGRYTLEYAQAHPNVQLFGLEKSYKWLKLAATRLQKSEANNIQLIWGYAQDFLDRFIMPNSVDRFHVMFPDPWPKRRHQHRRWFSPKPLASMSQCLKLGGEIFMATDDQAYFNMMQQAFTHEYPYHYVFQQVVDLPWMSNFRAKYEAGQRRCHFAIAKKIAHVNQ